MTSTIPVMRGRFSQPCLPSEISKLHKLKDSRILVFGDFIGSTLKKSMLAPHKRCVEKEGGIIRLAAAAVLFGAYVGASILQRRMEIEKANFSTLGYIKPAEIIFATVDLSNPSTALSQLQSLCYMLYRDGLSHDFHHAFFRHLEELMNSSAEARDAINQVILDTCHHVQDIALNDANKDPKRTLMTIRDALNTGLVTLSKVSQEQYALHHNSEKGRGRKDKSTPPNGTSYRLLG
ncbi:hypothetical protein BDQ17DRAFT_1542116 [Cyathus striatus]|nr:hypothetical protein BDQ17DRAFT_1542116 [Cyathus striatus]